MQGRVSGFFMTVVMALPLAAIPLMSIFGIPQFGSLASTLDADTGFLPEDPTSVTGWDSAPVFSAHETSHQDGQTNSVVLPVQNSQGSQQPSVDYSSGQVASLTWEQAIEQLARYGIHDYRLQPGVEANTFHFACYLHGNSSGQSGATIVRFEAEAANPLQAVQKTLQQIEQWSR